MANDDFNNTNENGERSTADNSQYESRPLEQDDDLKLVEDDGLSLVEDEAPNDQADNARKEVKYQLQADGANGLRFVSESAPTGGYSLSSGNSFSNIDSVQQGSANDAPTVAPPSNSSQDDVYALAEPEPTPIQTPDVKPTKNRNQSKKNNVASQNAGKSTKKTRVDYDENDDSVSLDDLYARRTGNENGSDDIVLEKRTVLPERPFWDNLLTPFCSFHTLLRLGLIAAAAFIPLLLATAFFTRTLSGEVQQMLLDHRELGALSAFAHCIWHDKLIFLMFCFIWGVFSTPYIFHIFTETASGADEFNEWPEYSFLGGLGQFLWILCLIAIAGFPGSVMFKLLHLNPTVGFAFSSTCLTPIFYLSCMQADALFALITKDVALSLKRVAKSWACFFGVSFAFLFGTMGYVLIMIWLAVHNHVSLNPGEKPSLPGVGKAMFVALLLSVALSVIPAVYLRILGRLAWIIEDDVRKRSAEEDDDEIEEDNYEEDFS